MPEIMVLCEGKTEREFCKYVIADHLRTRGITLIGTLGGRPGKKWGGMRDWQAYRRDLLRLARERSDRYVAVLVDYYAMSPSWPGRAESAKLYFANRGIHVEQKLRDDLTEELHGRFHPCVQLHEFESLLFVEPDRAARKMVAAGHEAVAQKMHAIKSKFLSVEEINDSPQTAPSKRLIDLVPSYDKAALGVAAAMNVTLPVLRDGCPWLDRWLTTLEALAGPNPA